MAWAQARPSSGFSTASRQIGQGATKMDAILARLAYDDVARCVVTPIEETNSFLVEEHCATVTEDLPSVILETGDWPRFASVVRGDPLHVFFCVLGEDVVAMADCEGYDIKAVHSGGGIVDGCPCPSTVVGQPCRKEVVE